MKRWFFTFLALTLVCAGLYAVGSRNPTDLQSAVQSGDLVRIHILAHDDSTEQQNIKLHVRDAILEAFTPLLGQAQSGEEAARMVQEHLDDALDIAQEAAREMGFDRDVQVEFGVFDFPERVYGNQVVPAGEYQALRILLGDAKGKNWWCVMYPPLCFSGEDYEGEVRFESSLAKWFQKIREEIANAKEDQEGIVPAADDGDVADDGAGIGGSSGRVLGQSGRDGASGAA